MPRLILIGMVAAIAAMCLAMTAPRSDPRLVELATQHAQQQALQNERLTQLQQKWQAERTELYEQRDELERDRRQLADDRQRAPVIAESIRLIGMLLLALLPLAVCALLLRRDIETNEAEAVAETLVSDLLSEQPTLGRALPVSSPPAAKLALPSELSSHTESDPT